MFHKCLFTPSAQLVFLVVPSPPEAGQNGKSEAMFIIVS